MSVNLDQFRSENEELVLDLEKQYPNIEFVAIEKVDQVFGVAFPSRPEMERFAENVSDTKKRYSAMYNFILATVKYPSISVLKGLLDLRPGLVFPLCNECSNVAGMTLETERKKF